MRYFFANEISVGVSFRATRIWLMTLLGECNVVLNPKLAGSLQEAKQSSALFSSGSAANYNNNSMVWHRPSKLEKIVPVACEQNKLLLTRKL